MKTPDVAFETHELINGGTLPAATDRIPTRIWVITRGAQAIPVGFNEVSKMFHAMPNITMNSDWFVQEGLVHPVSSVDSSWLETGENPLFVEFTEPQRNQMNQNVRGFICKSTDLILVGVNENDIATAIPPAIQDLKSKAIAMESMMKNDPSKELTFALKNDANDKTTHKSPKEMEDMLNLAASLLGGFSKLVDDNGDILWQSITSVTHTEV